MKMVVKFQGSRFNRAEGNRWNLSVEDRTPGGEARRAARLGSWEERKVRTMWLARGQRRGKVLHFIKSGISGFFVFKLHLELKKACLSC